MEYFNKVVAVVVALVASIYLSHVLKSLRSGRGSKFSDEREEVALGSEPSGRGKALSEHKVFNGVSKALEVPATQPELGALTSLHATYQAGLQFP